MPAAVIWTSGLVRSVSLRGSPGKTAPAAAGFRTGPLLENPYRAGHLLRDEYAGQYSVRRGPDCVFATRIDEDTRTVIVLDISHRSDTYGR